MIQKSILNRFSYKYLLGKFGTWVLVFNILDTI